MIYLYLKTHNVTGLKYLGKTIQNPFLYSGSGTYWTNHLAKYGYDISTEILFQTEDPDEFKKVAIEYSEKLNIVESREFANLMTEQGYGGPAFLGKKHADETKSKISETMIGKERVPHTDEAKSKISEALKGRTYSPEIIEKYRAAKLGNKHSEETKAKISSTQKGVKRKPRSEETKQKIRETLLKRKTR